MSGPAAPCPANAASLQQVSYCRSMNAEFRQPRLSQAAEAFGHFIIERDQTFLRNHDALLLAPSSDGP